ncbi:hypothetical protein FM104_13120 [Microbacterium esteraromaticum]|uniref:HTH cro/C1-type domain-containing protein n=1 Tax=Microbacterium esteraromaticum TaxID=57043 RepID=A0A1R4KIJ1_9MICO|nr:helix-turn-helix transcriptional regulator [Microbacterium esteraromaticum]SJN44045.1 hypothetical protein FM104_13120 [Microbacterium esteraromaticum]
MGIEDLGENRAISERIELLMVRARLRSLAELARKSGINRATISLKMNNHRRWNIEDLRLVAPALGVSVSQLLGEDPAAATQASSQLASAHGGADEFARRIRFLQSHAINETGTEVEELLKSVLAGGKAQSDPATLNAIAAHFGAPVGYLLDLGDLEMAERIEAQIDLRTALTESGVLNVAARSLGQLSPEELQAITRIIRQHGETGGTGG